MMSHYIGLMLPLKILRYGKITIIMLHYNNYYKWVRVRLHSASEGKHFLVYAEGPEARPNQVQCHPRVSARASATARLPKHARRG